MTTFKNGMLYSFMDMKLKYIGKDDDAYVFYDVNEREYLSFKGENVNYIRSYVNKNGKFSIYIHADKESTINTLEKANIFSQDDIKELEHLAYEVELKFERRNNEIYLIGIDEHVISEILWQELL